MSSIVRKHDITNLFLVVGGGLMLFSNLSALVGSGTCPYDHTLGNGYKAACVNLMVAFLAIESVAMMMGILVIILASMWNKDHNYSFAFIVYVMAGLNSMFGVFHAISIYHGLSFGILIVFSGLLVFLGGAMKYDRYKKILAPRNHLPISGEHERFEETQAQLETQETEEKTRR